MTVSKGIKNMLDHMIWCHECNQALIPVQTHMIKECMENCQYCKRATKSHLCKKHYEWVFPSD